MMLFSIFRSILFSLSIIALIRLYFCTQPNYSRACHNLSSTLIRHETCASYRNKNKFFYTTRKIFRCYKVFAQNTLAKTTDASFLGAFCRHHHVTFLSLWCYALGQCINMVDELDAISVSRKTRSPFSTSIILLYYRRNVYQPFLIICKCPIRVAISVNFLSFIFAV